MCDHSSNAPTTCLKCSQPHATITITLLPLHMRAKANYFKDRPDFITRATGVSIGMMEDETIYINGHIGDVLEARVMIFANILHHYPSGLPYRATGSVNILGEAFGKTVTFEPYSGSYQLPSGPHREPCKLFVVEPVRVGDDDFRAFEGSIGIDPWWFSKIIIGSGIDVLLLEGANNIHNEMKHSNPNHIIKHEINFGKFLWYERDPDVFKIEDRVMDMQAFPRLPNRNKDIHCNFRPEWDSYAISKLEGTLVELGYEKLTTKCFIRFSHIKDGGISELIWKANLGRDGVFDITKARSIDKPLFEAGVMNDSSSTDFQIFSKVVTKCQATEEDVTNIRSLYTYSSDEGIVLQTGNQTSHFLNIYAAKVTEISYARGDFKITIEHIQGFYEYFTVKLQSLSFKQLMQGPVAVNALHIGLTTLLDEAKAICNSGLKKSDELASKPGMSSPISIRSNNSSLKSSTTGTSKFSFKNIDPSKVEDFIPLSLRSRSDSTSTCTQTTVSNAPSGIRTDNTVSIGAELATGSGAQGFIKLMIERSKMLNAQRI